MMCEKIITSSKARKKKYQCDYCDVVEDRNNMYEIRFGHPKWRWDATWHYFMCKNCEAVRKLTENNKGKWMH